MTSNDLTITNDQTAFTDAQVAALRQIGVQEASPADLAVFLHQAKRTGLDPFSRQLYMIGRWDSRSKTMKQTIQTSIDGFRVVAARRAADMGVPLSISAALLADPATGMWREVLPSGVAPLAAKVTVRLGEGVFEAVARLDEYQQTTRDGKPMGMWGRMPSTMLGKCAEALALRKACPMDLSNLYTAEEMAQAEPQPERPAEPAAPAPLDPRAVDAVAAWADVHHVQVDARSLAEQAHAAGQAKDPDHLTAWLTTWLAANEGTADADDEVVQGELIPEEATDGE